MIWTIIFLLIGFIFLIKGADLLVEGSSSVALKYKVSNLVIGLTIVAFGTSAPELLISAIASFQKSTGIAMGNVIGSNISNTLLILGCVAVVSPIVVKHSTINKEIPFSLLVILAVFFLANDFLLSGESSSLITRGDGLVLLLFFAIFMYYTFGLGKKSRGILDEFGRDEVEEIHKYSLTVASVLILVGAGGLFVGGQLIVNSSTELAKLFGLSESLVGLTIIALGTSLPELAASVMAAGKGKADLAVGNVVGSNIFNFLWVIGLSSVISPIVHNRILNIDIAILFSASIVLLFLIYFGKKNILTRREGFILLSIYVMYIIYLGFRG